MRPVTDAPNPGYLRDEAEAGTSVKGSDPEIMIFVMNVPVATQPIEQLRPDQTHPTRDVVRSKHKLALKLDLKKVRRKMFRVAHLKPRIDHIDAGTDPAGQRL